MTDFSKFESITSDTPKWSPLQLEAILAIN
jgi:hypothetical protein